MGMAGLGLLLEGPLGSKGSFILSARRSYLDWIIRSTGLTAVPNYSNFQGKMTLNINKNNTLLINGIYGTDNINIEGEEEAGFSRGADNVDNRNNQGILGLTLKTFWNRNIYSLTTVSAVQNNYFAEVYENPGRDVFFTNDSRESEYTAKSDIVWNITPRIGFDFGGSIKRTQFQYDVISDPDTLFLYDPSSPHPDSAIGIFRTYPEYRVDEDVNSYKTALYMQWTFDIHRQWRLTTGLRYDYYDYNRFSSLSPRAGIAYQLNSNTTLNMAYGRHFQSPAYLELASNKENQDLESKFNDQIVAGIDYLWRDDLLTTVEVFYKEYQNVPINKTLTTSDPFDYDDGRYVNAGSGNARGFEIFLQKKLVNRFSTIFSYSYSESESLDPRFNTYYPSDYDFRHVLNFLAGYKYPFRFNDWYRNMSESIWFKIFAWLPFLPADEMEISFKFRYMGGRPFTPPIYRAELREWVIEEQQQLNTQRYPIYHRLDIRIDRRFIFDRWNMVIFFDLVNIYNRDNIWSYQYNEDGTIDNILHYKTLPVGGISLEF
jgi:outer membrane receptor protein involved in Fe transport